MSGTEPTSYDQIPYGSHAFPTTHPARLGVVAQLFGMSPEPAENCRILELGCASGGNLLPLASTLPASSCLGIDLSPRQVAQGQATIKATGLTNVEIRQGDILSLGPDLGSFHYILCHGVFSWVPNAVQEQILEICARHLTSNGIAYISYNTYPGWHMRRMVRDMMRYHVSGFAQPEARIQQARALLGFLTEAAEETSSTYSVQLRAELETISKVRDDYLFHEHLEEVNEPIYFHEMVDRAEKHHLQLLGEAELSTMVTSNFSPRVAETLQKVASSLVAMEQYMDFVRNRTFRQTLFCHAGVSLSRQIQPALLHQLHVASSGRPLSAQPDIHSSAVEQFEVDSTVLSTADPIMKSALLVLNEIWPQAISFQQLCQLARQRLGPTPTDAAQTEADARVLAADLLASYAGRFVELWTFAPPLSLDPGDCPAATPLARYQATQGHVVTTLRHETMVLRDLARHLLCLLDGSRDRAALLAALEAQVASGDLLVKPAEGSSWGSTSVHDLLASALEATLTDMARLGLLLRPGSQ